MVVLDYKMGDIVFIPLFKKTARADGHFRRPHLYEITESDTLEDLIFYAGGYGATVTEKARLELSRINSEARVREIDIFFSTEKNKVSQVLKDGDFLKSLSNIFLGTCSYHSKWRG